MVRTRFLRRPNSEEGGRAGLRAWLHMHCKVCVGAEFWQYRGSGLRTPELSPEKPRHPFLPHPAPTSSQVPQDEKSPHPGIENLSPALTHAQSWESVQSRALSPQSPVTRAGPKPSRSDILGGDWKNIKPPLPVAAPLLFFFFRLFFLAASSAVEVAPSSLSSGSKSPFRWLPEDAASSTPAMLPERARGSETERRGPAPPSATYAGDAGSRSQWWGAGNAGTAEDSIAGTAHRRLTDWPAGCSPDAAAAVPEVGLSRPGCGFLGPERTLSLSCTLGVPRAHLPA